jgi:ABC-type dipeptide/oligopeptide/nickel transport system permease subunit
MPTDTRKGRHRTTRGGVVVGGIRPYVRRYWLGLIGLGLIGMIVIVAILLPFVTGADPTAVEPLARLSPPRQAHWLGTDQFGRDVATRLAYGIRLSLIVGVASVAFALVAGAIMGLTAAYLGGWWDENLMRVNDVLLSFPYIVLAIALAAALGPGLANVIAIISVIRVPYFARLARGAVLAIRQLEYVAAAEAIGQRQVLILMKHILPNTLWSLIVMASLSTATAINAEAAISFLGVGIAPPTPSLGNMLSDAQQYVLVAPLLAVWPGLTLSSIVLGLNLLGDSLQELLDPRLRAY